MIPSAHLEDVFVCSECSEPLSLADDHGSPRCARCGWVAGYEDGVLDFVRDPERESEREYYEAEYSSEAPAERRSVSALAPVWDDASKPVNRALIRHIGDIRGSRVLLIGNGGSPKELHFLELGPELMVFSDLAPAGVRNVAEQVDLDGYRKNVCFAAIDALALPLRDESVDLVYGNAIVHHLPDRERFLAEVARVLKPGGRALFMDAGYAPAWQKREDHAAIALDAPEPPDVPALAGGPARHARGRLPRGGAQPVHHRARRRSVLRAPRLLLLRMEASRAGAAADEAQALG